MRIVLDLNKMKFILLYLLKLVGTLLLISILSEIGLALWYPETQV